MCSIIGFVLGMDALSSIQAALRLSVLWPSDAFKQVVSYCDETKDGAGR